MRHLLFWLCCLACLQAHAQTDSLKKAEENFDEYAEYSDDESVKRFCTQKVQRLSPTKLISVGYEWQMAQTLTSPALLGLPAATGNIRASHGLRLGFNAPVISRSSIIVNFGMSYYESRFQFEDPVSHPLHSTLKERGLRTTGAMLTVFKPLNEKNFVIVAANADLNGAYKLSDIQPLNTLTYSVLGVYGWKKSDQLMWGLGWARTYRLGEANNTVPVLLYNRTFNDRWGVEALLPARLNVRRNFSASSLLMLGYELEGNSYRLRTSGLDALSSTGDAVLRRSELKLRLTYEQQLAGFIWLSAQAGLRVNANFNVSPGESAKRGEYLLENTLTNPLFFGLSLNLVSP